MSNDMIDYLNQLNQVRQEEMTTDQEQQIKQDQNIASREAIAAPLGIIGGEIVKEGLTGLRGAAGAAAKTAAKAIGKSLGPGAEEAVTNVANDLAEGGLSRAVSGALNRGVSSATRALTGHDATRAVNDGESAADNTSAATDAESATNGAAAAESSVDTAEEITGAEMKLRDIIRDPDAFRDFVNSDADLQKTTQQVEEARQQLLAEDEAGTLENADEVFNFSRPLASTAAATEAEPAAAAARAAARALPPGVTEDIEPGMRVLADVTGQARSAAANVGGAAEAITGSTATEATGAAVGETVAGNVARTAGNVVEKAVVPSAVETGGEEIAAAGLGEVPILGPLLTVGIGLASVLGPLFAEHKHHLVTAPIINPSSQFGV
jgi:hypothetical protein